MAKSPYRVTWKDTGLTDFFKTLKAETIRFEGVAEEVALFLAETLEPMIQDVVQQRLSPPNYAKFMAKRTKVTASFAGQLIKITVAGKLESEVADHSDVKGGQGGNYNLWKVQEFGYIGDTPNDSNERKQIITKDIAGVKVQVKSTGQKVIKKHKGEIAALMPAIAAEMDMVIRDVVNLSLRQTMDLVLHNAAKAGRGWTIKGTPALELTGVEGSQLPAGSTLNIFKNQQVRLRGPGTGRFISAPAGVPRTL